MTEDMEFPRLTPPGERMPSGNSLFRRPEELTDEQFDLLAAAWAEDELSGDALIELESVIASAPGKRERANSFRSLRLAPGPESWPGMRRSLRNSPAKTAVRRTIVPALLAAAAVLMLILSGPAGAKLKTLNNPARTTGTATMAVAEIPGSLPVIRKESPELNQATAAGKIIQPEQVIDAGKNIPAEQVIATGKIILSEQLLAPDMPEVASERTLPLITMHDRAEILAFAPATDRTLSTITMAKTIEPATLREEKNWMLRSISFLAGAVTGREKEIDGYMIANGCINGLNTILGWDMELAQVSNKSGDPVAVSFSSSLLSFTKPLNKFTP